MNERQIVEKLMRELKENEHTIHLLMNTISDKDRQLSDMAATMRVMSETIDDMKDYIAYLTDEDCDCCCGCDDECCCGEYDEECCCDCEDDSCDCPEIAPCGRTDDERCCIFCEKMMCENANKDENEAEIEAEDANDECENDDEEKKDFFDFIGELIGELEKNPNLTDFEKDGFEVHIKRIK